MNANTQFIHITLFESSRDPFTELLRVNGIEFTTHAPPRGVIMASSEWIGILRSGAIYAPLAAVIVAFLKYHHSRKIIITTKDNTVVHAENLTHEELVYVLETAKDLTAIEMGQKKPDPSIERSLRSPIRPLQRSHLAPTIGLSAYLTVRKCLSFYSLG